MQIPVGPSVSITADNFIRKLIMEMETVSIEITQLERVDGPFRRHVERQSEIANRTIERDVGIIRVRQHVINS